MDEHRKTSKRTYSRSSPSRSSSAGRADSPAVADESSGIRAGELIGYRCWKVPEYQGHRIIGLKSMVWDYWWKYRSDLHDGANEADLEPTVFSYNITTPQGRVIQLPMKLETGGFYSFKTPEEAFKQMQREGYINVKRTDYVTVLGTLWAWGRVAEHQTGYRSQFAAIRGLDHCFPNNNALLVQLRELYGVQDSENAV